MGNLGTQFEILAGFYWNPARTASRLMDEGNWWVALALAVAVCLPFAVLMSGADAMLTLPALALEQAGVVSPEALEQIVKAQRAATATGPAALGIMAVRLASSPLVAMMLLAAFCTPALIAAGTWAARQSGSFGTLLGRDFGAAATGLLMAFAASHIPFALAGLWLLGLPALSRQIALGTIGNVWIASLVLFAVFAIFVARALWGLPYPAAALCSVAGLAAMFAGNWIYPVFRPLFWLLSSPCILILLWGALQGNALSIGNAFRGRANFRRSLEAAAVNPHDADAQYQLGLLFAQRRQYAEAIGRFENAVKIDPELAEAHFELGRIAREEKRFGPALAHLDRAASLNDKLQLSDIWREIGATQLAAGAADQAEAALRKFVERRGHDPEGLYLLGEVLRLKPESAAEARQFYQRAVEAAAGAPAHRQREARKWAALARKRL